MCGFLDEVELMPTDAKALLKDNSGKKIFITLIIKFSRSFGLYNPPFSDKGI